MTTAALLASAWAFRPFVLLACAAVVAVHATRGGLRSLRRTASLAAAVTSLLLALCSPLDGLAAGYLFSAHMLQHLLLVLVVPPLVLLALPPQRTSRAGVPSATARRLNAWLLAHPVVPWGAGLGAMWLWHAQALCELASRSVAVRGLQAVSLLAMGALFYWPLLAPRSEFRLNPLAGIAYLFSACVGCTLLGVLITFSPLEVCPAFSRPAAGLGVLPLLRERAGLSAAEDQQLGGLLMWVPACTLYAGGILGLLARWYGRGGEQAR